MILSNVAIFGLSVVINSTEFDMNMNTKSSPEVKLKPKPIKDWKVLLAEVARFSKPALDEGDATDKALEYQDGPKDYQLLLISLNEKRVLANNITIANGAIKEFKIGDSMPGDWILSEVHSDFIVWENNQGETLTIPIFESSH